MRTDVKHPLLAIDALLLVQAQGNIGRNAWVGQAGGVLHTRARRENLVGGAPGALGLGVAVYELHPGAAAVPLRPGAYRCICKAAVTHTIPESMPSCYSQQGTQRQ